jgi:hypothetical protein
VTGLASRDHPTEAQRHGSESGTDGCAHRGRDDQRADVAHATELRAAFRQPDEEQRGDHHLKGVAGGLAEDRAGRLYEVEDRDLAEHDSGPEADAPEDQGGHADAHRGPQRRDAPVQISKL